MEMYILELRSLQLNSMKKGHQCFYMDLAESSEVSTTPFSDLTSPSFYLFLEFRKLDRTVISCVGFKIASNGKRKWHTLIKI